MSLVAEHVLQTVRHEKRAYDMSHHLAVAGTLRPDGSFAALHTEVTQAELEDRGRSAMNDIMWRLCELWIDDFCDPEHWRAAGPLLRG